MRASPLLVGARPGGGKVGRRRHSDTPGGPASRTTSQRRAAEVKVSGRTCGQISRSEHVTGPAPPLYFAFSACTLSPAPRPLGEAGQWGPR